MSTTNTLNAPKELVQRTEAPNGIPVPPSPAPTTASFKAGDDRTPTGLPQRTPSHAVEFITRDIDRDTPAAPGIQKKSSRKDMGRKRSMKGADYYGEVFSVRETGPQIPKSAGVCVELKTNVILENEFDFAKSLSEMIAKRYGRSEDAVCISLEHSSCMIMGGTFDGTYVITITSVSMISPTCNKRNAALITEWFKNHLGVPADRGYVRFVDPDCANYAVGGLTVLDLMEKEEKQRTGTTERSGVYREKSMKRSVSRSRSRRDLAAVAEAARAQRTKDELIDLHDTSRPTTSGGKMKRKSMFNLFSRQRGSI